MSVSDFSLPTREHTFSTGRSAIIQDAPNVYAVFKGAGLTEHLDDYSEGAVTDPEVGFQITEALVAAMMVEPSIGDGEGQVPFSALHTAEVTELLELWQEAQQVAARFREQPARKGGGGGGKGVGSAAKPASRARTRKS